MDVIANLALKYGRCQYLLPLGARVLYVSEPRHDNEAATLWYLRPVIAPGNEQRTFLVAEHAVEGPMQPMTSWRHIGSIVNGSNGKHVFELVQQPVKGRPPIDLTLADVEGR